MVIDAGPGPMGADSVAGYDVADAAVLCAPDGTGTGPRRSMATSGTPHLTEDGAAPRRGGSRLVGIDSVNIDSSLLRFPQARFGLELGGETAAGRSLGEGAP